MPRVSGKEVVTIDTTEEVLDSDSFDVAFKRSSLSTRIDAVVSRGTPAVASLYGVVDWEE